MGLIINGKTIADDDTVTFNGKDVTKIVYNGNTVWEQQEEGVLAYTLSSDGTYYTVSGIGGVTDTAVVIPSTYKNLPVKVIGSAAFKNNTTIKNITIPSSITTIEDQAFLGCTALKTLTIPNTVTSIGSMICQGCTALTSVSLSSGCAEPGNQLFYLCTSLTSVTIPSGVTVLSLNMFSGTAIKTITIPSTVVTFANQVFMNCTSLTSVTIPTNVTKIYSACFKGCTSLTSATFKNTSGWKANSTSVTVTNPATNATYLVSTYVSALWTRS